MRLIYVDDEKPAADNFRLTAETIEGISNLKIFQKGTDALEWVCSNKVDVAFLDVEMPGIHGIELAQKLKEADKDIFIVFVTAYSQYALDAFNVDAIDYILKPYAPSDVEKALNKARRFRPVASQGIVIETIPDFLIKIGGEAVHITRPKCRELLALLVDRAGRGVTAGEAIACLWPEKPNDAASQSLFRMTYKRLYSTLEEMGIEEIVGSKGSEKFIVTENLKCDLFDILDGDRQAASRYAGEYMREYSWAEERNAQLSRIFLQL